MKIRKSLTLEKETVEYIENFCKEKNIKYFQQGLEAIIQEHKDSDSIEDSLLKKYDEKYKNMFTRIRLGTNAADINVQVLLECINAMAIHFRIKPMPVERLESELVVDSRRVVKKKIDNFKQKKDWNKKK